MPITIRVNGVNRTVTVESDTPFLVGCDTRFAQDMTASWSGTGGH
jgi:hypothetical protein